MSAQGKDGSMLDGIMNVLHHTSRLIALFNDKLVITTSSDRRLKELNQFYKFMTDWRSETLNDNSKFVSTKLWFDLQSMCLGLRSMVVIKLAQFPSGVIRPALINQDGVENHFCQVRSCNGQNNNPTYLQQESTQNSIRFGQTTISKKSNVGKPITSLTPCSLPSSKVLKRSSSNQTNQTGPKSM